MRSKFIINDQIHRNQDLNECLLSPPQLALEDMSSKWAARLRKEELSSFMSLTWLRWYSELRRASECVVGKAYGHSSIYTYDCHECDKFGYKFLYCFMLNWKGNLEANKQNFVKHWNEKHK
jgi:hypothetical protein